MAKPITKIVTIGGGSIRKGETITIDKETIRLTGKKHPRLLFIPTASSDSEKYWQHIQKYFGNRLGCKTDVLFLLKEPPSQQEIREKILSAEIIYVGGGNTLKMMRLWRRLGVDKLLKTAWQRGIVLCGISAGSICWFESGHSDSMSFYNPKKWKYINVRGLGFLKGIHCPHYNGRTFNVPRKKHFLSMIQRVGGIGIAIDNCCAIVFIDDTYRVIASKKNVGAFRVLKRNSVIRPEKIEQSDVLKPIVELFLKAN